MKRLLGYTLALFFGLLASGCSDDLGKRCVHDGDCDSPLRCLLVESGKGICSYPEPPRDASMEQLIDGGTTADAPLADFAE